MPQENVEVIRSLTERFNAGDWEGVLELIHPDLELFPPEDEPEAKAVYRGREGYREYTSYWIDTFDQWQTEVDEYIDASECVVVVGRVHARGRASGAQVEDLRRMGLASSRRHGHRTPRVSDKRTGPRSRRAVGVGDVAGERGDRAALFAAYDSGGLDALAECWHPDIDWRAVEGYLDDVGLIRAP